MPKKKRPPRKAARKELFSSQERKIVPHTVRMCEAWRTLLHEALTAPEFERALFYCVSAPTSGLIPCYRGKSSSTKRNLVAARRAIQRLVASSLGPKWRPPLSPRIGSTSFLSELDRECIKRGLE